MLCFLKAVVGGKGSEMESVAPQTSSPARVEPGQPFRGALRTNPMAEAAAGGGVVSASLVLCIYSNDESEEEPASSCSPILNH